MLRPRAAHPRIGRSPLLAATASTAAAAMLALPAGAAGGSYTVVQCHPSLNPTQGQAVFEQVGVAYSPPSLCATGEGLQIQHAITPTTPGQHGAWIWRAPAGTVFTSVQAAAQLTSQGGDEAGLWTVGPAGQEVRFAAGPPAWTTHQATGEFTRFHSLLRCVAATCAPMTARANVRNVFLQTEDRSEPVASITGGSLFAAPAVRGERTVGFEVVDQGGGVRELELLVNDRLVYADALGCQANLELATALRPCAGQASRAVSLPTGADPFTTGKNRIAACGTDLAFDGLANQGCQGLEVFVDDLCPGSAVGAGSTLSARFAHGKQRAKVRSDLRPRVKGKLATDAGDGIAGATVCALTRAKLAGEPYAVARTDITRNDGRYSLRLPAGPNRAVFVHRVFGDDVLAHHGLTVRARVRPSFEVKPRTRKGRLADGRRLRFKGRLPGPGCARRVVKVQAKIGKRRWQVFRSVRTGDGCIYRTRYKLRATSRPTRYLFRAKVPEQSEYPYDAGVSTVRVRRAGAGGKAD